MRSVFIEDFYSTEKITKHNFLVVKYSDPIGAIQDSLEIKLGLNPSEISESLINSKLFKRDESNHIVLIYTSNPNFNEYGSKLIQLVNDYDQNCIMVDSLLERVMDKEYISSSFEPSEFRRSMLAALKTNPNQRVRSHFKEIKENGLFLIFICCLFESANSYRSGCTTMVEPLTQIPNDITQVIKSENKSAELFTEVKRARDKIYSNLQDIEDIISEIHEDFQNRYNI